MNKTFQLGIWLFIMICCPWLTVCGADDSPGELSAWHAPLDCAACHAPDASITQDGCLKCHTEIAERINRKHGIHGNLTQSCRDCHSEHQGKSMDIRGFDTAKFNHNQTGFTLAGAHAAIETCTACHTTRSYLKLSPDCAGCHANPHPAWSSPDCGTCHTPAAWNTVDSRKFHTAEFKLSGRHQTVSCDRCHQDDQFSLTPTECQACHWFRQKDDPHATRLGMECGTCHTPMAWVPARWNHGTETGFPLRGSHKGISCDQCHPNYRFQEALDSCATCHRGEYDSAGDPDHRAAGFPMDCALCHSTTSWRDANFDHTFPIAGAHRTAACSDCHTQPGNFMSFSCLDCHTADWADRDHKDVPGYQYNSRACVACHPDGR